MVRARFVPLQGVGHAGREIHPFEPNDGLGFWDVGPAAGGTTAKERWRVDLTLVAG